MGFSHIFFADDLILFGEANLKQANVMRRCLDLFCSLSSQKVNFDKSCVYISPIPKAKARDLANICGFPLTVCLGKYLGIPVIYQHVAKSTCAN